MKQMTASFDCVARILCGYGYERELVPLSVTTLSDTLSSDSFALVWSIDIASLYIKGAEKEKIDQYRSIKNRQFIIDEAGGRSDCIYADPLKNQFFIEYYLKPDSFWNGMKELLGLEKTQFEAVAYSPEELLDLFSGDSPPKRPPPRKRRKKTRASNNVLGGLWEGPISQPI